MEFAITFLSSRRRVYIDSVVLEFFLLDFKSWVLLRLIEFTIYFTSWSNEIRMNGKIREKWGHMFVQIDNFQIIKISVQNRISTII